MVFLKQTNARNSSGSGGEALLCVLQRDAAQSEDGNRVPTGLMQSREACGSRGCLFEDRSEDTKVGASRGGNVGVGVAR